MTKLRFLSGNAVKIIGAIAMLFDHMGLLLFPDIIFFRIVGRLAFPIFAFMISEGAKYTKNRLRYFLTVFGVGALCQLPYSFIIRDLHLNTFLTFSLSIIVIYSLDFFKRALFAKDCDIAVKVFTFLVFIGAFALMYIMTSIVPYIHFDYGLYGCLMPIFASIPCIHNTAAPSWLKRLDTLPTRILCMLAPVLVYCHSAGGVQYYALISMLILLLYSGKRGRANMKYFFYIFYPAHIVVLSALSIIF